MKNILNNKGARTGVFFGATSGVTTTIGLIVGLHAGTQSIVAVLGGILVIAIADASSDAMGIHLAQEADPESTLNHIWTATVWTFMMKLVFALSFAVPLLLLPLESAVIVCILWALLVITLLSTYLARVQRVNTLHVISEHLVIAIIVVTVSYFIGTWVRSTFA